MGKKRKSGRSSAAGPKNQQTEEEGMIAAKYDQDETFADSQDEFFTGKDEIMLEEGPSRKRKKQIAEEDRFLEPSDEEVLGYYSVSDDEDPVETEPDSADSDHSSSEAGVGVQDWGTSKADYYDADIIETEADALEEEAEARRLQQKQLQGMTEADFGFDESEWAQAEDERDAGHGTVIEKLPDVVVTEDTPMAERLKILKSRYPELEPLSRDYTSLQTTYEELQVAVNTAPASMQKSSKKREAGQDEPTPSIAVLKWRALSTYLGSIAMYFAILTAPASGKSEANAPTSPAELRQHSVMQSLLRSRQSWDTVKDLHLPQTQEIEEESDALPEEMPFKTEPVKVNRAVPDPTLSVIKLTKKSKTPAKFKATASPSKPTKTESFPSKDPAASKLLTSIDALITSVKTPIVPTARTSYTSPSPSSTSSDFGDELPLTSSETASKAARKRNLRFYTSQLAQKSNKRSHASQNAGGDADLPYKERLKDRQVRLLKEAEVRGMDKGKGVAGGREMDFRDDDEDDDQDMTNGDRDAGGDNDEEDYYQTITSASRAKKAQKVARSEAANSLSRAAAGGQAFADSVDPSSKRAITYEISANKGLMPRRKKEVRNPRVKKRMKYDQKMKKLGSVRQVYKGGEGRGGYSGELTGIKTNVVRAVKL